MGRVNTASTQEKSVINNFTLAEVIVDQIATRLSKAMVCISLLLFFVINSEAANKEQTDTIKYSIDQVETFILKDKKDSAAIVLSHLPTTAYTSTLSRIIQDPEPSYDDLLALITNVNDQNVVDYKQLSHYIDTEVKAPSQNDEINMNYVEILWLNCSIARSEILDLNRASKLNEKLEQYISRFDPQDSDVKRASVLANTHKIVMAQIRNDTEKGKALCKESEEIARALNDTSLIILSLYHYTDFLINENKLDEYIAISERCYQLDQNRTEQSSYYVGNLQHLLNAYIYKGGFDSRVAELLEELYHIKTGRFFSYSLYAQFLSSIPVDSKITKDILRMFKVDNIEEFCNLIYSESENEVNLNELVFLLQKCSRALIHAEYYEAGINYMSEATAVSKRIYTEELAQQLADYETSLVVKEKEMEIEHERERASLYVIIATLSFVLLLLTIGWLFYSLSRSKTLKIQNEKISLQNEKIEKSEEQKGILLKELQHRVKNNFQIILNLLEMQGLNLENEEAQSALREAKNRIKSMAFIHKTLIQNTDLNIRFDEYVKKLVNEITYSFNLTPDPSLEIDIPKLNLDMDTAIPIGLILNELVTNAFKYGFQADKKMLTVRIKEKDITGSYCLCISDNGPGISENQNSTENTSLGLKLVSRLAKQLHGEFNILPSQECSLQVTFKDKVGRGN